MNSKLNILFLFTKEMIFILYAIFWTIDIIAI